MHPKNPYLNRPPDFDELGAKYPLFQPIVSHTDTGKPFIDFKNPAALRELTRCLLKRDFCLDVVLPEDRLCPTLANRLDYLYHLLDIFQELQNRESSSGKLKALDIGTGATAIYAILLARIEKDAQIWATELNNESYQSASSTLERNQLFPPTVKLVKVSEDTPLLEVVAELNLEQDEQPFTFTLCNPPFYSSTEEMQESTALKALPTYAAPTAAANELVTTGGEVAFIGKMIKESSETKEKCLWYTSLIGKASSIPSLVELLKQENIDNYILLSIRQAHTTRWIIGWSFTDIRLPDSLTRTSSPSTAKYLPLPNTWTYRPLQRVRTRSTVLQMCEIVSGALRDTGTAVEWEQLRNEDPNTLRYRGGPGGTQESRTCSIAPTSVSWTRAARRKRAQEPITSRCSPLFHACLRIEELHEGDTPRAGSPLQADRTGKDVALQISLDWVRGRDRAVVESLWAFLVRKIGDAVRLAEQV